MEFRWAPLSYSLGSCNPWVHRWFSRRIVLLRCSNNNLSQTVLELFLKAIENDALWPSRIRVDYGVENVQVCDAMVEARGEGRGSFIA